jgi:hypothetical protein
MLPKNKKSKKSNNKHKNNNSTDKGRYAPQTPDSNRPNLGEPTQNPTTSVNFKMI